MRSQLLIPAEVRSMAYTTAECPGCGKGEKTERNGDVFRCSCGYKGHVDLDASRMFRKQRAGKPEIRSMTRPVSSRGTTTIARVSHSLERANLNEKRQTSVPATGNLPPRAQRSQHPTEESHGFNHVRISLVVDRLPVTQIINEWFTESTTHLIGLVVSIIKPVCWERRNSLKTGLVRWDCATTESQCHINIVFCFRPVPTVTVRVRLPIYTEDVLCRRA